jgi:hypothetical protein
VPEFRLVAQGLQSLKALQPASPLAAGDLKFSFSEKEGRDGAPMAFRDLGD